MYLATAFSAWLRVCQATGQISSDLMVLKKASTTALSIRGLRPVFLIPYATELTRALQLPL